MGMLNSVVVTKQGMAIKTRSVNIRRIPESERWDADKILGIRAVPWSPNGSDNAFDIQVGMERPAEMMPRTPGDVMMENSGENLPSQSRLRTMGSQRVLSRVPVSENWPWTATGSQRSMPEEDRRPAEGRSSRVHTTGCGRREDQSRTG